MAHMDDILDKIAPDIRNAVSAAVNSGVQAVAKELTKQGIRGGLGDDRELRAVMQKIIERGAAISLLVKLASEDAAAQTPIPDVRGPVVKRQRRRKGGPNA